MPTWLKGTSRYNWASITGSMLRLAKRCTFCQRCCYGRTIQTPFLTTEGWGFFVSLAVDRKRGNRGSNGPGSAVVGRLWGSVEGLLVEALGGSAWVYANLTILGALRYCLGVHIDLCPFATLSSKANGKCLRPKQKSRLLLEIKGIAIFRCFAERSAQKSESIVTTRFFVASSRMSFR